MVKFIKGVALTLRQSTDFRQFWLKLVHIIRHEGFRGIKSRISRAPGNNYAKWVKAYDTITPEKIEQLTDNQSKFKQKPLISVIMPVFNPAPVWLKQAIDSVCNQIYPNWELCIADDASTDPNIRHILDDYQSRDSRIRVIYRTENGHIAACSNSALDLVSGEWVALLDHDDLLAPTALHYVAEAICTNPGVMLIYSDEDKIGKNGKRSDPYFKCDWNPDLFFSQNMFSHLGVYHTRLVKMAGKFRPGFEGSQDYDLTLRCLEHITSINIHHIPRVLYHWRIHSKSTALSVQSKPYAMIAAQKALQEHFQRSAINATPESVGFGFRIRYALPEILPLVSLIIPTRNGFQIIKRCISSIKNRTDYPNYEIIVIDNGSDDPATLDYLAQLQQESGKLQVIQDDRSFNFSSLVNQGVRFANGTYIALVNNDIEVINSGWLTEMMQLAIQPGVGAVGAKLYYPDNTVQHAGIILGLGSHRVAGCAHNLINRGNKGYFGRAGLTNTFSAVTAACMVVNKEIFISNGGFDEVNLPVAYNDVDFCLRLREAGYRSVFTPYAELYHHESYSRGTDQTDERKPGFENEIAYMKKRWAQLLLNDPAYSPNLTLDYADFTMAWPPRQN